MAGRENEKIILIIVAVVAVIVLGVFFFMMGGYGWGGMMGGTAGPGMMGWRGMGFGWMLIGPVFAVLFIVLIVYGVYYIFSGRGVSEPQRSRPLDILKERYARGEITEEQYSKMKKEFES